MNTGQAGRPRGERGAVLVHVAVVIVGLMAFSMFAIDYGVLWTSRSQVQTAADAGALAGAVSLAFVDPDDNARARQAAASTAILNRVWGQPPEVLPDRDVTFITCPPNAPGLPDTCVRVDAYRGAPSRDGGGDRGTVLPTFFAQLVGVADQAVRGTATAQVLAGNQVNCLKPWAIPDLWLERRAPATEYNRYVENGNNRGQLLSGIRDVYIPVGGGPVDGFTEPTGYDPVGHPEQIGMQVDLKMGNPQQTLQPGWFFPIDLPIPGGPDTGGDRYRQNIATCNADPVAIGDMIVNEPGNMIGPTRQGVDALIARDPGAYWDTTYNAIRNSCCAVSPRWVPIPVFSPEEYSTQDRTSGRITIHVVNILGFFIERMQGNDVVGRLTLYPGTVSTGGGGAPSEAYFLRTVMLVR